MAVTSWLTSQTDLDLDDVQQKSLLKISSQLSHRKIKANDTLFDVGDQPHNLYIVLKGHARQVVVGEEGPTTLDTLLGPGATLGCVPQLDLQRGKPRASGAVAGDGTKAKQSLHLAVLPLGVYYENISKHGG